MNGFRGLVFACLPANNCHLLTVCIFQRKERKENAEDAKVFGIGLNGFKGLVFVSASAHMV